MIITNLVLRNFGIFYGQQNVRFKSGLYVIHGRNGRGKTTILNAVRWTLYGHYSDRQGRSVPPELMLNRQARPEGVRDFAVELRLQEGDDSYFLRRTQLTSAGGSPPSQLYMEHNGTALSIGDTRRTIAQLLNEEVSRFFLFDGEQLQHYEALLFEDGGSLIKQSIEQILGLPVIDNALADLAAVKGDLDRRLARQSREDQRLQQIALRTEQLEADLDAKRVDLAGIGRQRGVQVALVEKCDSYLQQYESRLEQVKNLEALDERVAVLHRDKERLHSEIAEHLRLGWRDVLAAAVAPRVQEMESALARSNEARITADERDRLERSLREGRCATCGQPLDDDHEVRLANSLRLLPQNGEASVDPAMVGHLRILAGLTDTGHVTAAIRLDRDAAEVDSQASTVRQESQRLREALQNLPATEVNETTRARDAAQQALGRLSSAFDDVTSEAQAVEERLSRAQEESAQSKPSLRRPQSRAHPGD